MLPFCSQARQQLWKSRAEDYAGYAEEHQKHNKRFVAYVLLAEKEDAENERDDYRSPAYHGDYGKHRRAVFKGGEVDEIGRRYEQRYQQEHGVRSDFHTARSISEAFENNRQCEYHGNIDITPALYEDRIHKDHYIFVEQSARNSRNNGYSHIRYAFVAGEMYALLATAERQEEKGRNDHYTSAPLP